MRNYLLAGLLIGPQLAVAKGCNANNCLRQVRASSFPTRHAVADCSSFFLKTVYPATATATQTITVTVGTQTATSTDTDIVTVVTTATAIDENRVVVPRQVTQSPSEIPAYASSCHDVAAYSSACSCIGITAITTTFLGPTSTTTLTVSVTGSASTGTTTATTTSTTATTTYTCPAVLPTQVVVNPGFESDLSNWSVVLGGNEVLFGTSYCGVIGDAPGQDCEVTGRLCNCADIASDSPGGTAALKQVLTGVCPGREYSFVAYVGLSNNVIDGSAGVTTVSASLGGVTLFEPFLPCTDANPCTIPGGSGNFMKIGPITITPQLLNPVLELDFVSNHPTNIDELDLFVDDITLTLV